MNHARRLARAERSTAGTKSDDYLLADVELFLVRQLQIMASLDDRSIDYGPNPTPEIRTMHDVDDLMRGICARMGEDWDTLEGSTA